ncbi:uncharacterized [Tachysurus ichikawai]
MKRGEDDEDDKADGDDVLGILFTLNDGIKLSITYASGEPPLVNFGERVRELQPPSRSGCLPCHSDFEQIFQEHHWIPSRCSTGLFSEPL